MAAFLITGSEPVGLAREISDHLTALEFVGLPAEVKEGALKAPQPREEEWFVRPTEYLKDGIVVLKTSGGECPACGGQGLLTFEPASRTATNTKERASR